jgi:hypothetical protein
LIYSSNHPLYSRAVGVEFSSAFHLFAIGIEYKEVALRFYFQLVTCIHWHSPKHHWYQTNPNKKQSSANNSVACQVFDEITVQQ